MVGTLSVCPPYELLGFADAICFAHKRSFMRRPANNWHDGQITSDFPKSCQPQESKIFRFRCRPNQSHNSARLTADEGRWPSSRTCGEMRWTRKPRLTSVVIAYGEVVWSWRRGAGVKLRESATTVARKPFTGESSL